jgi:hypothetical protein
MLPVSGNKKIQPGCLLAIFQEAIYVLALQSSLGKDFGYSRQIYFK